MIEQVLSLTEQVRRPEQGRQYPHAWALLDGPKGFRAVKYPLVSNQKRTRELVHQELNVGPGNSVLDICCGTGAFAELVSGPYLRIDLNEQVIRRARERCASFSNKRVEVIGATSIRLEAGPYGCAMSVNAMHHFDDDLNRGILGELSRVVRESEQSS